MEVDEHLRTCYMQFDPAPKKETNAALPKRTPDYFL